MSVPGENKSITVMNEKMAGGVKNRFRLLLLFSSLSVALLFGLSFYYALVSTESSVASQFPELAAIVGKLKGMLVMNTIVFAAIVIASFYVLSILITTRLFNPLGTVQTGMNVIHENRFPAGYEKYEQGPFSDLQGSFNSMVAKLRGREERELKELSNCLHHVASLSGSEPSVLILEGMIKERKVRLGLASPDPVNTPSTGEKTGDGSVFMQPV